MSEGKFETMSSLVDNYRTSTNEASVEQAIDEMLKDDNLSTSWQNYHLIGDVMRDEVPETLQIDLTDQIADAIAKEATILSPNNVAVSVESLDNTDEITPTPDITEQQPRVISAQHRFKAKVAKLVKPLGQIAIAASAAGLMIVGVQQNGANNEIEPTLMPTQVVQTMPFTGYANPVSLNSPAQSQPVNRKIQPQLTSKQKNEQLMAQHRRFQALLSDHQQQVKLTAGNKAAELVEKK